MLNSHYISKHSINSNTAIELKREIQWTSSGPGTARRVCEVYKMYVFMLSMKNRNWNKCKTDLISQDCSPIIPTTKTLPVRVRIMISDPQIQLRTLINILHSAEPMSSGCQQPRLCCCEGHTEVTESPLSFMPTL